MPKGCIIPQIKFGWLCYCNSFLLSFAELQSEKEELEKKYVHIVQILESEKTAKWQLLQQCEDQAQIVSSLKEEVYIQYFDFLNLLSRSPQVNKANALSVIQKIKWMKFVFINTSVTGLHWNSTSVSAYLALQTRINNLLSVLQNLLFVQHHCICRAQGKLNLSQQKVQSVS